MPGQWFLTWGSRPPQGLFAFFLGVMRASDKNIHNYLYILYSVYGITFCHSQNNMITWQRLPTFPFKIALSVIMTTTKLSVIMTITIQSTVAFGNA